MALERSSSGHSTRLGTCSNVSDFFLYLPLNPSYKPGFNIYLFCEKGHVFKPKVKVRLIMVFSSETIKINMVNYKSCFYNDF